MDLLTGATVVGGNLKTMDEQVTELATKLGRLGGKATLKKHGREYFAELGRKSQKARKARRAKAKKESQELP